jgi:prepilin-type N-terminal cleavage/methylation domain-containing protein
MKKGFTITELLVAVGLLAAVLAASTMIFHYAIEAQRTAMATAEIMRTMRAITDQLNMDFAGLRTSDAPMIIKFHDSSNDANDSIVFFANGDFQDANGLVRGNVARIYYGQAGIRPDTNSVDPNKILVRKQVILEPSLPSPAPDPNVYEPYSIMQLVNKYLATDPNGSSSYVVQGTWIVRPRINPTNAGSIAMYLAKGVDNFSIMYCSKTDISGGIITWHRLSSGQQQFFGFAGPPAFYPYFKLYPDAIKFTFTLYDSKKILKTGRTFEHIVYIGK